MRHFGLPGWTANQLSSAEGNLDPLLERIKDQTQTYPSLVIILAGTNDLAYCTDVDQCHDIFQSIVRIHTICHEKNIDTIALSIPSSAWQSQGKNNDAASFAKLINEKIESWAVEMKIGQDSIDDEMETHQLERGPVVHYVSFPITGYDPSSGYWSPDGLHFSAAGYQFVGESLATNVKDIFDMK